MIKRIVKLTAIVLLIGVLAFLIVPLPSGFFSGDKRFEAETPVDFVASHENHGAKCRPNTIYSTDASKEIHTNEGYEFTVDNYCANIQKELIEAIDARDIASIRRLIALGANPRTRDYSNFESVSPVNNASFKNAEVLKILLDNGGDPNEEYCCCGSCSTPLVQAVTHNDVEMVELLLVRGAKVRYKPKFSDVADEISDAAYSNRNGRIVALLENACGLDLLCRAEFRVKRVSGWWGFRIMQN